MAGCDAGQGEGEKNEPVIISFYSFFFLFYFPKPTRYTWIGFGLVFGRVWGWGILVVKEELLMEGDLIKVLFSANLNPRVSKRANILF